MHSFNLHRGIDSISIDFLEDGTIDFGVTDGYYDRNYRLDKINSDLFKSCLGFNEISSDEIENHVKKIFGDGTNRDYYIDTFEKLCKQNNIQYNYSYWSSYH